jgi:hypothetical protein
MDSTKKLQAQCRFLAVAQMVGFGLRRSKIHHLSMGIDAHSLRHIILKYNVHLLFFDGCPPNCFWAGQGLESQRDPF